MILVFVSTWCWPLLVFSPELWGSRCYLSLLFWVGLLRALVGRGGANSLPSGSGRSPGSRWGSAAALVGVYTSLLLGCREWGPVAYTGTPALARGFWHMEGVSFHVPLVWRKWSMQFGGAGLLLSKVFCLTRLLLFLFFVLWLLSKLFWGLIAGYGFSSTQSRIYKRRRKLRALITCLPLGFQGP